MPGLTTAFAQGVAASRPAAATSNAGYVYFATDTGILSQSTGSSWTTIGPAVALDSLTTKGDLLTRTSSAYGRLGVGSNDQVLTADSTASTGVKWATPASGFSDPLTTRGDLIVRGGSGTTRLALGSSGQYLKSDGTDATWAAASSGALTQLSALTADGSSGVFDFTSISGAYTHLQIWLVGRLSASTTDDYLLLQLNADSGANYTYAYVVVGNSSLTGVGAAAGTTCRIGDIAGATAPANSCSTVVIDLPFYAGTTFHKAAHSRTTVRYGTAAANTQILEMDAYWLSTAAITEVKLTAGSGNFVANSKAILYGLL